MKWFPLCNFTHYYLQRGFSKPTELASKCSENSYSACGIADYKSISGAVTFYKACVKNNIKPIIGCELPTTLSDYLLDLFFCLRVLKSTEFKPE